MGNTNQHTAIDFFAGSGLVTEGLSDHFKVIWANDNCPNKRRIYVSNFGESHFVSDSIEEISGQSVPQADLSWASFPCQDLSLAGNMKGIESGHRSALYWDWIRILDEMPSESRPKVLCIENVVGFLVAQSGRQFSLAYNALKDRGYVAGAFVLDTSHFTPQSRPRCFLVATHKSIRSEFKRSATPLPYIHTTPVMRAFGAVSDPEWAWWKIPCPPPRSQSFTDICDLDAPVDTSDKTRKILGLLTPLHSQKLNAAISTKGKLAGTGYKRARADESGQKRQRLEIRFDGIAGCLRTPKGGSSRQHVIIVDDGKIHSRLLTIREAARLMGLRDDYRLPGSYNEAYHALGDAVAVPVTRYIAEHLLSPLCEEVHLQLRDAVGA